RKTPTRFDLAILYSPGATDSPSNEKALQKFIKVARSLDIAAELITRDDYGRLAEFDALFIRDTTFVNQYTYRFSRRAAGEGLVVMDDPLSIARCTNKVYLAELLTRHKIPIPRTIVAHEENAASIGESLGFPCVIKIPDSAFSRGVVKVSNQEELDRTLKEFFQQSELVVAQEFLPTDYDWRIGIIDRQPLYACKYYMAQGHWQIVRRETGGKDSYGKLETIPVELAPRKAVQAALKAANLVGDGLYGVDVKESGGNYYVIEVNDNPNLDAGCEDAILKDELYRRILNVFLARMEQRKSRNL
ncbi:MAG: RimK family alpha-L-glutamate ligase, partial [Planctomycetaceae bacterium]|nr:RimK family alpha-L-glutamate ligase [Planctomycetaceae bacterium]